MRAAVSVGARRLQVAEVDAPRPGPGHLAIDVRACGICGSNLHEWRAPERSIAPGGVVVPGVAGHELVGTVATLGAGVDGPAPGTRVVVEPNLAQACGTCPACRDGTAWFCRDRTPLPVWGFAERVVVRAPAAFPVPAVVPDAVATLVEPLACGVHGLRGTERVLSRGSLDGATVAVVGAGVAGLLVLLAAGHLGAGRRVAVARHRHQARAADALGAHVVLDAGDTDLTEQLRAQRPDVVVEAVGGNAATFDLAVRAVVPGGEVVVLGLFHEPQSLDVRRAVLRELRLSFPVTYGVRDGVHDVDVALEALAAGGPAVGALVSHRFGLDDVDAAFARADDKSDDVLRVVVEP